MLVIGAGSRKMPTRIANSSDTTSSETGEVPEDPDQSQTASSDSEAI